MEMKKLALGLFLLTVVNVAFAEDDSDCVNCAIPKQKVEEEEVKNAKREIEYNLCKIQQHLGDDISGMECPGPDNESQLSTRPLERKPAVEDESPMLKRIKERIFKGDFGPAQTEKEVFKFKQCRQEDLKSKKGNIELTTTQLVCHDSFARSQNNNGEFSHEFGNNADLIKRKFVELLDSSLETNQATLTENYLEFISDDGNIYVFNLKYPMGANPIQKGKLDGSEYYSLSEIKQSEK